MRTAIILTVDAKGVPKVTASGPYEETKAGADASIGKLKAGESLWIVASGYPPKIIKAPKASSVKSAKE